MPYNKTAEGKKVKAVLQTIPGADYQTKLQTIMGSSNAPDVFFNWGGGSITQFQKAGLLLPLNGFMKANPKLKSSFLPSILNAAKIGNELLRHPDAWHPAGHALLQQVCACAEQA